ncbi:MAG: transcription antitermination factor NusB [Xanthomonadales bacterium]|nr:transcription antitermination factor NusB [Xanthomonadales bacterium]MDZ4117151.1 transcription antitermination factor NusB [Xanthomonadaceae bacterium]MDZ4378807.1 transcription antitermination factor NusB [Xanthomonadaceae bacterium]
MKHSRTDGIDPAARSRSRRRALQAVYAWQLAGAPIESLLAQFRSEQDMEIADLAYFEELVSGVVTHCAQLDEAFRDYLDREVAQVDPIERAVLRIATYELIYRLDVPYRVVINEAIEITKRFGADHGHTYINGVLDKAAAKFRAAEAQAPRGR